MGTESILLQIAIALAAAKIAAEVCERWLKQPAVLGEIVAGLIVGQSALRLVDGNNATMWQIAQIGAVLLLLEVGLESDLDELFKVGARAVWVACSGVLFTLILGYLAVHALGQPSLQSVFVAGAMAATSVGITARVFADLKRLQTTEARIVLGAAVADDVIGLIIVAAVTGLAVTRVFSVGSVAKLTGLAVLFLAGAVIVGLRATPLLLNLAHRMRTRAALSSAAVVLCLLLASLAEKVQLAPIVGAFAAGLVLSKAEHKVHFEGKVKSVADVFVPVFFVMMGARMNLSALSLGTAQGRTVAAMAGLLLLAVIAGKVLAGLTVPAQGVRRWIVGVGMIPRGEVSLISAGIGLQAGVVGDALYSAIVLVVILTTCITPPLLKMVASGGSRGGAKDLTPAFIPAQSVSQTD